MSVLEQLEKVCDFSLKTLGELPEFVIMGQAIFDSDLWPYCSFEQKPGVHFRHHEGYIRIFRNININDFAIIPDYLWTNPDDPRGAP